jgi:uncharacterized membrane protein YdjX (TVP38/TMEM64 family)
MGIVTYIMLLLVMVIRLFVGGVFVARINIVFFACEATQKVVVAEHALGPYSYFIILYHNYTVSGSCPII